MATPKHNPCPTFIAMFITWILIHTGGGHDSLQTLHACWNKPSDVSVIKPRCETMADDWGHFLS